MYVNLARRRLLQLAPTAALARHARAATPNTVPDMEGEILADDVPRGELFQRFVVNAWETEHPAANTTLAIPANFSFPLDALYDCTVNAAGRCVTDRNKPRPGPVMFGVDINHYTKSDFSFQQLHEQAVRFVQMKTTQGTGFKDQLFPGFWARAGQLQGPGKVYRGAYHFLTAAGAGRDQADWFLRNLDRAGGLQPGDMAPGIDLEWDVYTDTGNLDHWKNKGAQFIIDTAMSCLERIEQQTGRVPVLYTGKSWFGPETVPLSRFKEFARFPLWVFDYDPQRKIHERPVLPDSTSHAAIWQYTASARVPVCYSGGLDASVFYGDEAAFKKTFGIA